METQFKARTFQQHTASDLCIALYRSHKSLLRLRKLISHWLGINYVKAATPLEQFMVLSLLERYPGQSQKWLCRKSGMSGTELGKVLFHLESEGLVERTSAADTRKKLSCLTLKGTETFRAMSRQLLPSPHAEALLPLLEQLHRVVETAVASTPERRFLSPVAEVNTRSVA